MKSHALLILLLTLPGYSVGQDDFFNPIRIDIDPQESDAGTSLFGWVTQKIGYGIETPDAPFTRQAAELNNLETSLFAQLDHRFGDSSSLRISAKAFHDEIYRVKRQTPFTTDEREKFRNRVEIRDFYVETEFDNGLYLKLGHQIIAWGQSEYLRVTDMVNTLDQYTYGQQDLEDIRLQVPAALLSYSSADWVFDLAVTYDAGRDDIAPSGDEFDPFIGLRQASNSLRREDPDDDHEVFLRASTHYSRGDIQFVVGEFNNNSLSVQHIALPDGNRPDLTLGQERLRAAAVSANWVEGSWLVFVEAGLRQDVPIAPTAENFLTPGQGWLKRDQTLGVVGLEYNGYRNLSLSMEIDSTHTHDVVPGLSVDENQLGYGARAYWTAMNERLQLLAVWNELVDLGARVTRVSLDYDLSDNLQLGALWVAYSADRNSVFQVFENNDVVQLQLRYSFQM